MICTEERKKLLKNIFNPPRFSSTLSSAQADEENEKMLQLDSWEKRVEYFDQLTLEGKFQLLQCLAPGVQAELLMYCNSSDADILILCNSVGAGQRFVLQMALKNKDVL